MRRFVIPIILATTILFSGVFAFIPINEAATVHTIVMANTQRIAEIILPTGGNAGEDLRITCPAGSGGCRILEIYIQDADIGADTVILGALTGNINNVAEVEIQANLNTIIDDGMEAVAGVSGVTFGGGDTVTIAITGTSDDYNAVIFIQVEGNTIATAEFVP